MAKKTVKVRGREGTATMDISIPADITRTYEISRGDVFTVEAEPTDEGQVVITYTRVYNGTE